MSKRSVYVSLGLVAFTITLFAPTLIGNFLNLDDIRHIPNNSALTHFEILTFWREAYFYLYAPVVYTVWAIIYRVSSSPVLFHALNIGLHAANVVLVYSILARLRFSALVALAGALVFAVHPLQVEAVAWISAGRDQISAFFGFLTIWLYLQTSRVSRAASLLTFALGLLAKPGLAPLPVGLYVLNRGPKALVAAQLVLAGSVLWLTRAAQSSITDLRLADPGVFGRLGVAVDALGFYARQIVWPYPLSADYARTPEFVLSTHAYVYGLVSLALVGGAVFYARRRYQVDVTKPLAFSALMFAPVLGFVPFIGQIQSTVSDRYAYVPLFGVVLALAQSSAALTNRRLKVAFLAVGLLLLSARTLQREGVWTDDRSLYTSIVEAEPRSYLGAVNLANEEVIARRFDHARELLRAGRALHPELATASAGLAQVYWMTGERDKILAEVKPLLRDDVFLKLNAESALDLSIMRLMVARAEAAQMQLDEAFKDYCAYAKIAPEGEAMKREIPMLLRTVKKSCDRSE